MAVVLLLGRYKDMADAAVDLLEPLGHRCLTALDAEWHEERLANNEHDIVVLGPSLSPPERDRAEAVARVSRRNVPVLHVRTLDEALALPEAIHTALDSK